MVTSSFNISTTHKSKVKSMSGSDPTWWLTLRKHFYTHGAQKQADTKLRHTSYLPERQPLSLSLPMPESDMLPEHV